MGSNTDAQIPKDLKRPPLLGDLTFSPDDSRSLGGLNYYSKAFKDGGQANLDILVRNVGLTNTSLLLDWGCGTGRLTEASTTVLPVANYYGMDINNRYVIDCKSRNPSHRVDWINVQHDEYNRTGTLDPHSYAVFCLKKKFDIIAAFGVFNHLRFRMIVHCLREMWRTLKPGGRIVFTAILLNHNSINLINTGQTVKPFAFKHMHEDGWSETEERPLLNFAIPETSLRRALLRCNFMIKEPVRYGHWCKSPLAITGHDVIIASKSNNG